MTLQVVKFRGRTYRNLQEARWGAMLENLEVDIDHRTKEGRLYGDGAYAPTFSFTTTDPLDLQDQEYFVDIVCGEAGPKAALEVNLRSAKLAAGSATPVLLIEGTVDRYRPTLFYPKLKANKRLRAWIRAAPKRGKSLIRRALSKSFVRPGQSCQPSAFAWVRRGVGLDVHNEKLAIVTYDWARQSQAIEDPYYKCSTEAPSHEHLVYVAYGLDNPFVPIYVDHEAEDFEPSTEYVNAMKAVLRYPFKAE